MELIRGWERQYAPDVTGGLRLSKARRYRASEDADGKRDVREGENRVGMPASVSRVGGSDIDGSPMEVSIQMGTDEPAMEVEGLVTEERREVYTAVG